MSSSRLNIPSLALVSALLLIVVMAAACGSRQASAPIVSVACRPASIDVGGTAACSATASSGGSSEVKWESADNKIATVTSDGTVTALTGGNVVITATIGDLQGRVNIPVFGYKFTEQPAGRGAAAGAAPEGRGGPGARGGAAPEGRGGPGAPAGTAPARP
jgi:hypothetical protein